METALFRDVIKIDLEKSRKMFFRAFITAILSIPLAKIGALGTLPLFLGVILYCIAVFRLYHTYIFVDAAYFSQLGQISASRLVISKLAVAAFWLTVIFAIGALAMGGQLKEITGEGLFGVVSIISLYFQGILMITITYLAVTCSHVKLFSTYKTLAGIFMLVALYVIETEMIGGMKRAITGIFGGIEGLLSGGVKTGLTAVMSIEFTVMIAAIAINLALCCYLLKNKMHEPIQSVR